ncbi:hypothetical protein BD324DRAFT_627488 [Kockovaella imperatae]|uniref:Uncharacterized protein n=1 Tax=Kockovaella imperatae TaxID=4999 RepID=A0A1Y1UH99_9TREE|nr:hypothetical protein BD324DRAFT_627488 [Kockovaella imperatae]ORX36866.1 hypothetical protein BD324DRAFT_627488 [Kockovaella imperatae]
MASISVAASSGSAPGVDVKCKEKTTEGETVEFQSHSMRITSGGSIHSYVRFALKHLKDNPAIPLVLHTLPSNLPSSPSSTSTKKSRTKARTESSVQAAGPDQQAQAQAPVTGDADVNVGSVSSKMSPSRATSSLHPCTLTVPRLISVVELIKRQYLLELDKSGKGKGKHRATGLWQYTQSGLLSDSADRDQAGGPNRLKSDAFKDPEALKRVLEGSTRPKMRHRPYLKITLSTRPLDLEKQKNTTCQYVLVGRSRGKTKGRSTENGEATMAEEAADKPPESDAPTSGRMVDGGGTMTQHRKDSNLKGQSTGKKRKAGEPSSQDVSRTKKQQKQR